ncbi:MAG: 50S ribosomal protein L9 [Spirochaetia bacterium]|jgi:large subunit ribosomal protein L9|nr:50S ribosomal protein L9 [Spirochaetales bacterium]MDX9783561.1 50S ribosomal protein L9 [Spirochaetia bacterium]
MKVILNQDVPNLGEIGDVKVVAPGYARNYLLPRDLAVVYNARSVQLFEQRKNEILSIKEEKRKASSSLKERIESEELSVTMPAGANGKLYGAVTNATVADELLKKGLEIDRKKIEVPGRSIKNTGSYKIDIHLYEKESAILKLTVLGQEVKAEKTEEGDQPKKQRQRRQRVEAAEPVTDEEQAAAFEAAVNAGRLN